MDVAKVLTLKSYEKEIRVQCSDILFLQAYGNYTKITTVHEHSLLYPDGIGKLLESKPEGLFRVHKSYAVNVNFINSMSNPTGSKYCLAIRHYQVPVSRQLVNEVRGLLSFA